jgi:hypothetical protein
MELRQNHFVAVVSPSITSSEMESSTTNKADKFPPLHYNLRHNTA